MTKLITAILAAFAFTLAAPQFASATATGTSVTIGSMHVYGDNHYDVNFSADVCNDSGALQSWAHALASGSVTADGLKAMLSVLLAARLAGKSVTIYTNGISGGMCALSGVSM